MVEYTMEAYDCPVVGTKDIADQIDMTSQGTRRRLEKLVEKGELERKKIGGGAVIYWPVDD